MKVNKGFTLIELLVVIAIIAMLMAILVPALRSVKIQAHMAVCLSNLNGLSKGFYAYAENNKDWLVNGNTPRYTGQQGLDLKTLGNRPPYWVDAPQDETYHYKGEPTATPPTTLDEKQLGIMRGAMFDYVGSVNSYHCPGDLSKMMVPNNLNPDPENYSFRSYCVSGFMNGWMNDTRKVKKMAEVISPGTKFAFVETTDNRGWLMGSWDLYLEQTPPASDTLAIWHKERSGFGFADGHAEMHTWKDEKIIKAARDLTIANPSSNSAIPYFPYDINSDDYKFIVRGYVPGRNIRKDTSSP